MSKMGKKQTAEKINQYAALSHDKLQSGSKDTGVLPKWAETVVRAACNGERLSIDDVKARRAEKTDVVMYINNRRVKLEVKCSAGAVFYAHKDGFGNALDLPNTLEEFDESQILSGADLVVYAPDTFAEWLNNPAQVLRSSFVMSRADFIGLLLATAKGKTTGLKLIKPAARLQCATWWIKSETRKQAKSSTILAGWTGLGIISNPTTSPP